MNLSMKIGQCEIKVIHRFVLQRDSKWRYKLKLKMKFEEMAGR